jgi:hypothetical protein
VDFLLVLRLGALELLDLVPPLSIKKVLAELNEKAFETSLTTIS